MYIKRKQQVENIHSSIQQINNLVLEHNSVINDFFTYDTKNQEFFKSGYSDFLDLQNEKYVLIKNKVLQLKQLKSINRFHLQNTINQIITELDIYEIHIDDIVTLIKKRGFQDYGVEGEMRDYIHKLEELNSIDLVNVLMLRRHEKDYIIRNEEKYIQKLNKLSKLFEQEIKSSQDLNNQNQDFALIYLANYTILFNKMVKLDKEIGIKDNTALRQKIYLQGIKITTICNELNNRTQDIKNKYFKKLRLQYIISITLLIGVSIILSLYLSKRITLNLSILSKNMASFVKSNFNPTDSNTFPNSYIKDEVGILIDNYKILRSEIISLITDLQKKVEKRTQAITCQKERIEQQKEEIEAQRDELFEQNKLIEFQKHISDQRNKDVLSSIRYAKLIQDALMPSQEKIDRYFKNNFVLYKPKDIISGDFYWTKRIKNTDFDITILAAADCTGHGVPGAMMSMLGVALLNEIVLKKEVRKANEILDKLREKVIESLQNQSNQMITNDGMDIGLVLWDHKTNIIQFTGANRPLYFIRNNELQIIEGNKMPIGKHGISNGHFENINIKIESNDMVYLFSDGYADQFGGPKNKKFKRQRLQKLLLDIHSEEMNQQKQILDNEHEKWRQNYRQTDDILLIGIRF